MPDIAERRRFLVFLIKPSHYDDDGYVIQWRRSALPSNSLACLYGIAKDAIESGALGDDVDAEIFAIDETNTRVRLEDIARQIAAAGGHGLVGFVGVQSNQFPRVMDVARPLRAAGVQVCIGGFHVSGCLAMLPETPDSLKEALDLGISLFAGEAEGRFADVLRDAAAGTLRPIYNYLDNLPNLDGATTPFLPKDKVGRSIGMISSFDAGRGCPFLCSFCTIINVQGRKSRYRTADDIERIVRANHANGVRYFFITDDNLARNRNWEAIFDRLIALREEGIHSRFVIQVDTMCHKIPRFVEKAAAAGVKRVFIGLENINPDSLNGAKKKQNHIADYREMLLAWRKVRCISYCGYILGFPNDTPESIVRDIKIIQRELPLDILQFSCLTPLPGSEDHAKMVAAGAAIDPDLNKFDLEHAVCDHPRMSRAEWQDAYHLAWRTYYTDEHMKTVIRRAAAGGPRADTVSFLMVMFWAASTLYNIYPLEAGLLRRKYRLDRRPSLPIENRFVFYPREAAKFVANHTKIAIKFAKIWWFMRGVLKDPNAKAYTDEALQSSDYDHMEIFQLSDSARAAGAKAKRIEERVHGAPADAAE
ncbi:B12-binding domain-containing radical SAM protein [Roseiarcus sp.]|uniref:B12-binding domain-containing radical SAM protein n=1 Tax=Roseiarcus sp. TaxID=1969460 RepID=UPI003F95388D